MKAHDVQPDGELTAEQLQVVAKLSDAEVRDIDRALLENTAERWRKVARVVGDTMLQAPYRDNSLPDIYYAGRIRRLVEDGTLESQGNLSYMRYSEVRRPITNET